MTVAFKEWQVVCEALRQGKQSIIFRKGGIAEGREGFEFRHQQFYLYPTLFHQQYEQTTWHDGKSLEEAEDHSVEIASLCNVVWTGVITDWQKVQSLNGYHIWREEVLQERFEYKDAGAIHLAVVRVHNFETPCQLVYDKSYGGCKSWIQLKEFSENSTLIPVIEDLDFESLHNELKNIYK